MFVLTYWRTRASPRSRTRIGFCSRTDRIDRPRKTCNQNERVARCEGRSKPASEDTPVPLLQTRVPPRNRGSVESIDRDLFTRYPHLLRSGTAGIQLRGDDRTGSAVIARLSTNTFGNLARDTLLFRKKRDFVE